MRGTALRSSLLVIVAFAALVWAAAAGAASQRRALDCTGPPGYALLAMTVQATAITLQLRIDTTGGAATATVDFLPAGAGVVASKDLALPGSGVYTISSGPALSVHTGYTVGLDLRNLCDSTQAVFFTSTFPASDSPSVSVIRPVEGGRVTANVGRPLDCGEDCSATAPAGTAVTLTALAAAGYTVAGWDGAACSIVRTASACTFTLAADVTVGVRFAPQVAPAAPDASAAGAGNAAGGAPKGAAAAAPGAAAGGAPKGAAAPAAGGGQGGAAAGTTNAPAVKRPRVTQPVAKRPVAKKPVAKKPVAKRPAAKKPVAKKPVAKRPAAKKPVAKRPAAKRPVVKRLAGKRPPAKKPVARRRVGKQPVAPRAAPLCAPGQRPASVRPCRPRGQGAARLDASSARLRQRPL